MMSDEAKKLRADYIKKWKAEHPDRQKEYTARYWERKAAQKKAEENK